MIEVPVRSVSGEVVRQIQLDERVFGITPNTAVLHQAVVAQLANRRRGTHSTKTRGEVAGGGKKPWRQKGTGRARQGSIRAVQWRKGGRAFAIRPVDHGYDVPKKVRKAAMRSALSLRVREGKLVVLDELKLPEVKTKALASALRKLEVDRVLLVDEKNDAAKRAARNLPNCAFLPVEGVGLVDVLRHEHLVLTRRAAEKLQGALTP